MSIPVIVYDLEFVARTSLAKQVNPGLKRVACFAGMYFGLYVAHVYSQTEVTDPNPLFWEMLEGRQFPRPTSLELVIRLARYTNQRFNFAPNWIKEPGLRYGATGNHYALGTADAILVAIKQVPMQFKYLWGNDWKKHTLNWIEDKIIWASSRVEDEVLGRMLK